MSRSRNVLTSIEIKAALKAGLQAPMKDGGGLQLLPNKRWVYYFRFRGKEKELWLGRWPDMGLAKAREARDDAEEMRKSGVCPTDERAAAKAVGKGQTFAEFAAENVASLGPKKQPGLRIWLRQMTTQTYLGPLVDMTPNEIGLEQVEDALRPYWSTRTASSIQLRMRIRRVLSMARVRRLITADRWTNPAIYRDNLEHSMPKVDYVEEPRRSLPWPELPGFMAQLRAQTVRDPVIALAAEWMILSTMRVTASVSARWGEIDLQKRTWTVPASLMKGREGKVKEHVIPLNLQMVRVLRASLPRGVVPLPTAFIFASRRSSTGRVGISSVRNLVVDLAPERACPHGFRATFETWAEEETDFDPTVITVATGHVKKDKVQRRYARSNLLEKRRALMRLWGRWCDQPPPAAQLRQAA